MIRQQWFRLWFGAIWQVISLASVDPDLCWHVASLGRNELSASFQELHKMKYAYSQGHNRLFNFTTWKCIYYSLSWYQCHGCDLVPAICGNSNMFLSGWASMYWVWPVMTIGCWGTCCVVVVGKCAMTGFTSHLLPLWSGKDVIWWIVLNYCLEWITSLFSLIQITTKMANESR